MEINKLKDFNKLLRSQDLKQKGSKRVSFHSLRHSIATEFVKQGKSLEYIRRFLRHATIATTQKYLASLEEKTVFQDFQQTYI